jgi:hypothetical protein
VTVRPPKGRTIGAGLTRGWLAKPRCAPRNGRAPEAGEGRGAGIAGLAKTGAGIAREQRGCAPRYGRAPEAGEGRGAGINGLARRGAVINGLAKTRCRHGPRARTLHPSLRLCTLNAGRCASRDRQRHGWTSHPWHTRTKTPISRGRRIGGTGSRRGTHPFSWVGFEDPESGTLPG